MNDLSKLKCNDSFSQPTADGEHRMYAHGCSITWFHSFEIGDQVFILYKGKKHKIAPLRFFGEGQGAYVRWQLEAINYESREIELYDSYHIELWFPESALDRPFPLFQPGDLITGVDRSYVRSIYRYERPLLIMDQKAHIMTFVSFDGYLARKDSWHHKIKARTFEYRLATEDEIRESAQPRAKRLLLGPGQSSCHQPQF